MGTATGRFTQSNLRVVALATQSGGATFHKGGAGTGLARFPCGLQQCPTTDGLAMAEVPADEPECTGKLVRAGPEPHPGRARLSVDRAAGIGPDLRRPR